MPLVTDNDRSEYEEEKPQQQQWGAPELVVRKTETFWSMLTKLGGWFSRQKLPPGVSGPLKKSMRDTLEEAWTGKKRGKQARRKPKKLKPIFHT